jgi:hypothetical protein
MVFEASLLSLPVLFIGMAWNRYGALAGLSHQLGSVAVLSCGAGVYEEFIFRLIGFGVLRFIFVRIFKLKRSLAISLMVLGTSIAFSLYHYWGPEPFLWRTMIFRTIAGIYFGVIFAFRGFGLTVGSHTAYDIIVLSYPLLR